MYEYLQGDVVSVDGGHVILEISGIAYCLIASTTTIVALEGRPNARLYTELRVRDDKLVLFGFASAEERAIFRKICRVSGVGPSTAIAILSGVPVEEFRCAVADRDPKVLQRIKGVGKKIAERIVVELQDVFEDAGVGRRVVVATLPTLERNAVRALVGLDYTPAEAEEAVRQTARELPDASWEELFRAALRSPRSSSGGGSPRM